MDALELKTTVIIEEYTTDEHEAGGLETLSMDLFHTIIRVLQSLEDNASLTKNSQDMIRNRGVFL
jgi:hypothetical protein